MRVLYVWDADYPWDVRTEKVCGSLAGAGFEVHIVARNRAWRPPREVLPEGTVHRMRPWKLAGKRLDGALSFPAFLNPRWVSHIWQTARALRPAALIVRDLPLCPTTLWVGRVLGIPVVLDMAENYPAIMQAVWNAGRQRRLDFLVRNPALVAAVERYCLPRVDQVVVVVEESADRVVQLGVPASRVVVVSNTPPRERTEFQGRTNSEDTSGYDLELVYLGVLEIPRGLGDLLRAVALLRARGRSIRLRVVGDGRDRGILEEEARRLGLSSDIATFYGYVGRDEALNLVATASIGVVPHRVDEGWNTTMPNKLFDYMAAAVAVVSSDARPCARILAETGAGVTFASGDVEGLAAALDLLRDPQLRMRMGQAGQEAVLRRYNWEVDEGELVRALREIIQQWGPEPRVSLAEAAVAQK